MEFPKMYGRQIHLKQFSRFSVKSRQLIHILSTKKENPTCELSTVY